MSVYEEDIPPPQNTFRRFLWETVADLGYLRAYWGRRLMGSALGLIADMLGEGGQQAFFARLPGHPQQAPDSLARVGLDRDLFRFRNETAVNWAARVRGAWDDYEQAGTDIQLLHVINQFGAALWPTTWVNITTITESANPLIFEFEIEIPFTNVDPPFPQAVYGGLQLYGDVGLTYGHQSSDIPMLLYLVKKWKPARSRGLVTIYFAAGTPSTFTV